MPTKTPTMPAESPTTKAAAKSRRPATAKPAPSLRSDIAAALTTEPVTLPVSNTRTMVQIALAAIIDSPDNPRGDVGDVTGLAKSIRSAGLLEPVLVVPAALYRAGNNELPDDSDAGRFVLIAGHRRTAACRTLDMTHIDAIVEESKVGVEARKAMIIENFQRVDLTPLEEARAFSELQDLGLKQDEMAEQVGCSQSHISKRLGLLKLDEQVQQAVTSRALPIADALELGKLTDHASQAAALAAIEKRAKTGMPPLSAKTAVEHQQHQEKVTADKAKARELLRKAEIEEAADLQSLFGYDYWSYKLTPDEVKKHKKAKLGCLVGHINDHRGDLDYYCKAKKRCSLYPTRQDVPPHVAKEKQDEKDRRAAIKGRREAAARLALYPLEGPVLTAFLLEQYLEGTLPAGADAGVLAVEWFQAAGHGGSLDYDHWRIVPSIKRHPDSAKLMPRYAAALRVAGLEVDIEFKHRRWTMRHADYLRDLVIRAEYKPTPWEIQRLTDQVNLTDPEAYLLGGVAVLKPAPCDLCGKSFPADQLDDGACAPCIKAELDDTYVGEE